MFTKERTNKPVDCSVKGDGRIRDGKGIWYACVNEKDVKRELMKDEKDERKTDVGK